MKFLSSIILPLATAAATVASVGSCASDRQDRASRGASNITITSDKQERSFLLWVSATYSSKTPSSVILSYHGGNKSAKDQLELDGFTTADANAASIVVYPQGINVSLPERPSRPDGLPLLMTTKKFWQGVPGDTVNDIMFTNDILDYLESKYNVDKTRIYASGKSDGGGFCNLLACDTGTSQRIAAFAPVSGAFYVDTSPCHPDTVKLPYKPGRGGIPFLEFHGGNDTTIHYDGGARKKECLPAIPHFVQQWAVRNGLGLHNQTSTIADHTVSYTYGSGAKAGLVQHIFESDIGHDWPSTAPNADNLRKDHHVASYNATPIILDFFNKHHLN